MRLFTIVVATLALSQGALAQTSECKGIADSAARLACYDKATPVAATPAAARPAAAKLAGGKSVDGKYVDAISAEDALMNARLRNICRGC